MTVDLEQHSMGVEEPILLTDVVSEDKQAPPSDSEDLMPESVFLEQMARAGYV